MRKLYVVMGLAGALCAFTAQASFDGTVSIYPSGFAPGNGGEFSLVTSTLGNFNTFCLEDSEYIFNPPTGPYNYFQNSGAVKGGPGVDGVDSHTGLSMDSVSIGTAWLYSQFRAGTIPGYLANHLNNAGVLQNAIWMLEGEIPMAANAYVTLAQNNLPAGYASVTDPSLGAYGVIALNLYDVHIGGYNDTQVQFSDGTLHYINQDLLAIVPEPTTMIAGALLLLPFGASTLRLLRRRA